MKCEQSHIRWGPTGAEQLLRHSRILCPLARTQRTIFAHSAGRPQPLESCYRIATHTCLRVQLFHDIRPKAPITSHPSRMSPLLPSHSTPPCPPHASERGLLAFASTTQAAADHAPAEQRPSAQAPLPSHSARLPCPLGPRCPALNASSNLLLYIGRSQGRAAW